MEFTSRVLAEHGLDSLPVYREPFKSLLCEVKKVPD